MNRKRILPIVGVVALVIVIVAVVLARRQGAAGSLDASGTVEATEAELGFTVPGRIEAMSVQEGDTVRAGTELARLDRAETLSPMRSSSRE